MVYLNKITIAPYAERSVANSSNDQPVSRSFEARIRAAKAIGSQVIPEGDLSEYEWTLENPDRFDIEFQEMLQLLEDGIRNWRLTDSNKYGPCPSCSTM